MLTLFTKGATKVLAKSVVLITTGNFVKKRLPYGPSLRKYVRLNARMLAKKKIIAAILQANYCDFLQKSFLGNKGGLAFVDAMTFLMKDLMSKL